MHNDHGYYLSNKDNAMSFMSASNAMRPNKKNCVFEFA